MNPRSSVMNDLLFLLFIVSTTSAATHSLNYFCTVVSGGINFPKYTAVGTVDGEEVIYYDSNNDTIIPKTEWINKTVAEVPDDWITEIKRMQHDMDDLNVLLKSIMERYNHTEGVHTLQYMYGCELRDDTSSGYDQYGYDGEDFISLNLKTETWTVFNAYAEVLKDKHRWGNGYKKYQKNYLENTCILWLKKYISYGREILERKVPPEASVFQKNSPRSELVCHATGFYPRGVMMSWQKDREELNEDVEIRETLPNQDGSFQKRAILRVSPEELKKHEYTCVVQHSSLKEDLVRSLPGSDGPPLGIIVGVCVGVVVLALIALIVGALIWKKKKISGFKLVPAQLQNNFEHSSSTSSMVSTSTKESDTP